MNKNADNRLIISQCSAEIPMEQTPKVIDILHNKRTVVAGRMNTLLQLVRGKTTTQCRRNRITCSSHHKKHDGDENENGWNNEIVKPISGIDVLRDTPKDGTCIK